MVPPGRVSLKKSLNSLSQVFSSVKEESQTPTVESYCEDGKNSSQKLVPSTATSVNINFIAS
jgi:hypothetical protein